MVSPLISMQQLVEEVLAPDGQPSFFKNGKDAMNMVTELQCVDALLVFFFSS